MRTPPPPTRPPSSAPTPPPPPPPPRPRPDAQPTIDVANAALLLSTPRSVRKRLDFERPVERETLIECLELAVQAPTASNRQLWRWMIVTDPELKTKIADIYREQGRDYPREG